MKIAMFGHKDILSRNGGVEIVVKELSTRFAALGHDVVVFDRAVKDKVYPYFYKNVKVDASPNIHAPGISAFTSSVAAMCKSLLVKPDLIHIHAEGSCFAIPLAKFFKVPVVVTVHGLDWQRRKWGKVARSVIKLSEAICAKYADEIITLNKYDQQYFWKTYHRNTILLPNGVTVMSPSFLCEELRNLGLKDSQYFLFLGRIVPEKNVDKLITAFESIQTDFKLVIAGGSSDSNNYYQHVLNLAKQDSRILTLGFVEGDRINQLFSNAYIYILPSEIEGHPLSLLEAASSGCCCLTSDIKQLDGILGDSSLVFSLSDSNSLKESLMWALDNPKVVGELGNRARNYVVNNYNWDLIAELTLDIYTSVIEDR